MKTVTIYLHSSKESNYTYGEEIGLTGKALDYFLFALYEVACECEVDDDGGCTIIKVDGQKLERKE